MSDGLRTFSERVWSGRIKTVDEARARYKQEGLSAFVSYASTLYSFRDYSTCSEELRSLRTTLITLAPELCEKQSDERLGGHFEDRVDVLSTILVWMSTQREIPDAEQEEARQVASQLIKNTLAGVQWSAERMHTRYLLMLTGVQLKIFGADEICSIARSAPRTVKDSRQLARICVKLGIFFRESKDTWVCGMHFGIRAIVLPQIPLRSRIKGIAALLGMRA
jgi:hypothetical protein